MITKNTEEIICAGCKKTFKRRTKGSKASRLQPNVLRTGRRTCSPRCSKDYRRRKENARRTMRSSQTD